MVKFSIICIEEKGCEGFLKKKKEFDLLNTAALVPLQNCKIRKIRSFVNGVRRYSLGLTGLLRHLALCHLGRPLCLLI